MMDTLGNDVSVGDLVVYKKHRGSTDYAVALVSAHDEKQNILRCYEPKLQNHWKIKEQDKKVYLGESNLKKAHWTIIARIERQQIRWVLDESPGPSRSPVDRERNNKLIAMLFNKQDEILAKHHNG